MDDLVKKRAERGALPFGLAGMSTLLLLVLIVMAVLGENGFGLGIAIGGNFVVALNAWRVLAQVVKGD